MEDFGTGVVTKLESGRFDHQYNVEISLPDGTKLNGYDAIQVYDQKKDGTEAKVWPMVKDSYMNKTFYDWKGNTKQSDTKAGTKTYATIVFAEGPYSVDGAGIGPSTESGGGSPPPNAATSAPSTDHSAWGAPPKSWGERPVETLADPTEKFPPRDNMQDQIVASWAIKCAINVLGSKADSDNVHTLAHELIVLKERIASELSGGGSQ